jgi:hypothetical protein
LSASETERLGYQLFARSRENNYYASQLMHGSKQFRYNSKQ